MWKVFSLEEVSEGSQVVYEFDKAEMLEDEISGEINFTKADIGNKVVSIEELREKMEGDVRMEDKKKTIFFGSSRKAADTMDEVASLVGSLVFYINMAFA